MNSTQLPRKSSLSKSPRNKSTEKRNVSFNLKRNTESSFTQVQISEKEENEATLAGNKATEPPAKPRTTWSGKTNWCGVLFAEFYPDGEGFSSLTTRNFAWDMMPIGEMKSADQ